MFKPNGGPSALSSKRQWLILGAALAPLIGGGGGGVGVSSRAAAAPALPTGGQVRAGGATITASSGSGLTINQTTGRAIIDWQSFSIGQGGAVQFNNGSGATLNRVTGGPISNIDGLLSATGDVFLINPSGVIIGKTGVVSVGGGFTASTLDVADNAFMSRQPLTFSGSSAATAANYGRIGALGGDVALIAARVENDGVIDAPQGDVGLIAGYAVQLQDKTLDNGRFSVLIGGPNTASTNAGVLRAAEVELRANGGNVYALAGNTGSVIQATGVAAGGGRIFLVDEGGGLSLAGHIQARSAGGVGGSIETSASTVDIGKAVVDAGVGGTWRLDPNDLTIDQTAANTIQTSLDSGTNVIQQTTAVGTGGQGDIAVGAGVSIDWTSNAALTLSAYRNVSLGAGSTIASIGGGAVTLYADNTGTGVGTVGFGASATVSTSGAVSIFYNPSVNPAGSVVNTTSYVNPTESYAGHIAGGATLTAYMLVNTLSDLQNMQNNLGGTYALNAEIDASATQGWNGGAGFAPIGTVGTGFSGLLYGQNHIVTGLFIDRPSSDGVGLFGGTTSTAVIDAVGLTHDSVTGATKVGGLVGYNEGSVSGSIVSVGSVQGAAYVGGLVGLNDQGGAIHASTSNQTVTGGDWTGGLVGTNSGVIEGGSLATGAVTGSGSWTGGLVGVNYGVIASAYAEATVAGATGVGGLAGYNIGSINGSTVNSTSIAGGLYVGGMAGLNDVGGTLNSDGAAVAVSGSTQVGGLVGANFGAIGGGSFVTGAVAAGALQPTPQSAPAGDWAGGLAGVSYGAINASFSTATVSGATGVGGLVGYNNGTIDGSSAGGAKVQEIASNLFDFHGAAGTGGLVGLNDTGGTIENSSSHVVTVMGGDGSGGLVGVSNGLIEGSLATGSVMGDYSTGGLVGANTGVIRTSSSSAQACGGCSGLNTSGGLYVGGLVGYNNGSIDRSFATGDANAGTFGAFGSGLVGYNDASGVITNAYSLGCGCSLEASGLVGVNAGTIRTSYAIGLVPTSDLSFQGGGLIYLNQPGGSAQDAYWDVSTSHASTATATNSGTLTNVQGVGGSTGLDPHAQSTYAGFDFTSVWAINPGTSRPYLIGVAGSTPMP